MGSSASLICVNLSAHTVGLCFHEFSIFVSIHLLSTSWVGLVCVAVAEVPAWDLAKVGLTFHYLSFYALNLFDVLSKPKSNIVILAFLSSSIHFPVID